MDDNEKETKDEAPTAGAKFAIPTNELRSEASRKKELRMMPLSLLLPRLGRSSDVVQHQDIFKLRLEELQKSSRGEQPQDRKLTQEISMLNQVLQWLGGDDRK